MRLSFIRALLLAFAASIVVAPVTARAGLETHVWVNNTTDKFVWTTAFSGFCGTRVGPKGGGVMNCTERHIVHEWCTAPGTLSKQGFHLSLTVVHVLVTEHPNCGRPIVKDWTLDVHNGSTSAKVQYNVTMHRTADGLASYHVETTP